MERIRFILTIALWLLPLAASSQIKEEDMLALLEKNDLVTARDKVYQVYRKYPSSATAAYFHALLQENADTAIKLFQEISTRFQNTVYAERALFRLGQYHFADGTYQRARQYFLNLLEQYPASNLAPQAAYYAAKSLLIIGNSPQIRDELSRCAEKYPGTWMANFAADDLARLKTPANHHASDPKKQPVAPYAVQIGAYTSRENAASHQRSFSKAGYSALIKEKNEGRRVYYQVLVGEFTDRNKARAFADEIQRKYKLRCNVVKRE
ncbi:MAG: SPOR domain-containing protein, partial [bacterium]